MLPPHTGCALGSRQRARLCGRGSTAGGKLHGYFYSFKDKLKTFLGKRKVKKVADSMKRNIVDKSKCIRCRKCSMSCPTGNIKYDKTIRRIVFYDHCDACLRCVNFCPSNAISINALTKIKHDEMYVFNINNYNLTNINISENELYKKYKSYFDYIDSLK